MLFYKNTCYFFFIVLLVSIGQVAYGQKEDLKNPWVIGLDIGTDFLLDCASCSENSLSTTSISTNGYLHVRVTRLLGLTANLGYHKQQSYGSRIIPNYANGEMLFLQRDIRLNYFHASIGPSLMYRLGQGDLAAEFRLGIHIRNAQVYAVGSNEQIYDVKYESNNDRYSAFKLGYTYWPKRNFGINFSIEFVTAQGDFLGSSDIKTTNQEDILLPENSSLLSELNPGNSPSTWGNFLIGVVYRFK